MISLTTAQQLKNAGVRWTAPVSGDRFAIPRPGLADDVFVVSEMTVEVHDLPSGRLIKFNGTTEWALDTVEQTSVVWLPSEEQLRTLLSGTFVSLRPVRTPGAESWVVETVVNGSDGTHEAGSPSEAYAAALLGLLAATRD